MDRNKKYFNENYFYTYMGMEFFSGEGLDLIFPLGGGAIFQPRGGLGGAKQQNFLWANVDIYKNIRINYKMRRQPQIFY